MQDVVESLVPMWAPCEMLYVSKRARRTALEWLWCVRGVATDDTMYYDIVAALTSNIRANVGDEKYVARFRSFTTTNFVLRSFKRLCYASLPERLCNKIFCGLGYYDAPIRDFMIEFMCLKLPAICVITIANKWLNKDYIADSKGIKGSVETLFDHTAWIVYNRRYNMCHYRHIKDDCVFNDKAWNTNIAQFAVEWTMTTYPDIIDRYVGDYVVDNELGNDSHRCMQLVVAMAGSSMTEDIKTVVSRKLVAQKHEFLMLELNA